MIRAVALTVVVLNAVAPVLGIYTFQSAVMPLAGLLAILCLSDGRPLLGFAIVPHQGWGYWCRVAAWIGVVIGLLSLTLTLVWYTFEGNLPPIPRYPPTLESFLSLCLRAPVEEEVVSRWLFTIAFLATLGERMTILASGFVFALLHIQNGNPGPDNLIAGFFLQWAYLRSGTILVPIAMHAAGNFLAFSFHVAAWYEIVPGT